MSNACETDEAVFAAFVHARGQRLLHTALLLTRDAALAEDLLQTALARTWTRWASLDEDPEAYVRRVLVNTYASWWRRRWRGETPHGELPEPAGFDPHTQVDDREELWMALGTLTARQRAVLVLRYFEDLSEQQTAQILDISVGTVKSSSSRALARLRTAGALTRSAKQEGLAHGSG